MIAERALKAGVKEAVLIVVVMTIMVVRKALAEAARAGGLVF